MLSRSSRYIDTEILRYDSKDCFDLWKRVSEILHSDDSLNFLEHTVNSPEVGCLDLIADRYYNNERLWWFIAAFNNIIDPVADMYPGQTLKIPSLLFIQSFIARSQNG